MGGAGALPVDDACDAGWDEVPDPLDDCEEDTFFGSTTVGFFLIFPYSVIEVWVNGVKPLDVHDEEDDSLGKQCKLPDEEDDETLTGVSDCLFCLHFVAVGDKVGNVIDLRRWLISLRTGADSKSSTSIDDDDPDDNKVGDEGDVLSFAGLSLSFPCWLLTMPLIRPLAFSLSDNGM